MTETPRIIIVEDDVPTARSLQRLLVDDGFAVSLAFDGAELKRFLRRGAADLVLLDLNLGSEDGLDIARELAGTTDTGLIIVTGRGRKSDCITGLQAGADDYVTKPFDHDELRARIRAVLRRRRRGRDWKQVVTLGPYRLNTADRCLSLEGSSTRVEFTGRESYLLASLMARPAASVHRADLSRNESWSPDERATDVHVSHIRRKLQEAGMSEICIQPVRGIGYRLTLAEGVPPVGESPLRGA